MGGIWDGVQRWLGGEAKGKRREKEIRRRKERSGGARGGAGESTGELA